MIPFFLLSALSASTFTLGKEALNYTTPLFLIAIRFLCAGVLFLLFFHVVDGRWKSMHRLDWLLTLKIVIFAFLGGYFLEFWALNHLPSSKTALLSSFGPVMAALLSYIFLREVVTPKKIVGLLISIVGCILPLLATDFYTIHKFPYISVPELAMLGAVACFAYGWIVIRVALKDRHLSILLVNGIGMFLGGLGALFLSIIYQLSGGEPGFWFATFFPVTSFSRFVLYTGSLIFIGNICCYMLYGYILKRYTATMLTFGELLTPLFAALYGWLFLNERVGINFFFSLAAITLGLFLYYQEEHRLGYIE